MVKAVDFFGREVQNGDVLLRGVRSGNTGGMTVSYVIDAANGKIRTIHSDWMGGIGSDADLRRGVVIPIEMLPLQYRSTLKSWLKSQEKIKEIQDEIRNV